MTMTKSLKLEENNDPSPSRKWTTGTLTSKRILVRNDGIVSNSWIKFILKIMFYFYFWWRDERHAAEICDDENNMSEGSSAFDMLNSMSRLGAAAKPLDGGQAEVDIGHGNQDYIITQNASGDVFVELSASSERLSFLPSLERDNGKAHEKLIQSGLGFQIPDPDDNLDADNGELRSNMTDNSTTDHIALHLTRFEII